MSWYVMMAINESNHDEVIIWIFSSLTRMNQTPMQMSVLESFNWRVTLFTRSAKWANVSSRKCFVFAGEANIANPNCLTSSFWALQLADSHTKYSSRASCPLCHARWFKISFKELFTAIGVSRASRAFSALSTAFQIFLRSFMPRSRSAKSLWWTSANMFGTQIVNWHCDQHLADAISTAKLV